VSGGGLLTFKGLQSIGLSDRWSDLGLPTWWVAFNYVRQLLERGKLHTWRIAPAPDDLVRYESFHSPWYELLLYGAFILGAGVELGGFIAGFFGSWADENASLPSLAIVASVFWTPLVLFFIGTLIGTQSDRFSILILLGVAVLGRFLGTTTDFLLVESHRFEMLFKHDKTLAYYFLVLAIGSLYSVIVAGTFGLLGFWRGRRVRLGRYLQFLLQKLPPTERKALIDMAYEEASAKLHPVGSHGLGRGTVMEQPPPRPPVESAGDLG
jgi:hypothetical protein